MDATGVPHAPAPPIIGLPESNGSGVSEGEKPKKKRWKRRLFFFGLVAASVVIVVAWMKGEANSSGGPAGSNWPRPDY